MSEKKDYAAVAHSYCIDAINDNLSNRKASKLEKLACQRHLNDLARQDDPDFPYYFSAAKGNRHCRFLEKLRHVKGKWKGQLFVLEPHQTFGHCTLFGWLKKKNDFRRFTKVYWELPRKNGKAIEINTPIATTKGWKKHGDLEVGDFVCSPYGKAIKVLAVTENYSGLCYAITFSDGEKIIAHEHHEWKLEDEKIYETVELCNLLTTGNKLTLPETICNKKSIVSIECVGEHLVNCITVKDSLYFVGEQFTVTHNSFSAAGIALFMAFVDKENDGAEVYAGATTEAQARMVFAPAYEMVKNDDELREAFNLELSGTSKNPTSIFRQSDMSIFMPVVGQPGDGASVSCGICDEYHEHRSSVLLDTFSTGTGSRDEPLIVIITTAGFDLSSPCYSEHLNCIKILEGSVIMDNVHCMIFGVDPEDDWTNFEVWRTANPNYLISITEDSLIESYNTAMASLKDRAAILTKRLNIWQNSGAAWMDMQKFNACEDKSLTLEMFKGKECWLSIDLASKIDLCALMFLFKIPGDRIEVCPSCGKKVLYKDEIFICENNLEDKGCTWERKTSFKVVAFGKYYVPSETCEKTENSHYQLWRDEGVLTVTEGARTDFREIENDIKIASKGFNIKELTFDQREAGYLVASIQEWAPFECVEFPQGPNLISAPMKELEGMIYAKDFIWNGDKLLYWSMGNVVKKQARSGGSTKHAFPTKQKDSDKIDPVVSLIMGIGRLMVSSDDGDSYNKRAACGEEEILRVI